MRLVVAIGALMLGGPHSATHTDIRYRVEATDVVTMDDGDGTNVDTIYVNAVLRLSVSDSTVGSIADFVVESAQFRHTTGPGSSSAFEEDPVATGSRLRLHVVPGRKPTVLSNALGANPGLQPVTAGGNPSGRANVYVGVALNEIFPTLRQGVRSGDRWSDTTRQSGVTIVRAWTIGKEAAGILDIQVHDSSATSADIDGSRFVSSAQGWRALTSSPSGPVIHASLREQRSSTITDPTEAPHLIVTTSTRTIRIARYE